MRETWVRSLGWEDPLEKATPTPLILLDSIVNGVAKSWTPLSNFHFDFTRGNVWMSVLLSQFIPPSPSPHCVRKSSLFSESATFYSSSGSQGGPVLNVVCLQSAVISESKTSNGYAPLAWLG